jgi:hypothetical protein
MEITRNKVHFIKPDSESPTLSFKDGKSVAIEEFPNPQKNRIVFVQDHWKSKEQYIPAIISKSSTFSQIPDITAKRDCLYISAPNQSGKTTYLANYVKYFKDIYPEKPIFLFSSVNSDPIIDKYKPRRIIMDEEFLNDPPDMRALHGSLTIFDDVDQIKDKNIRKIVFGLIEEILCNGAHDDPISIIVTYHLMTNYKETRVILNECGSITIFPKSGSAHQIRYTLRNYYGLNNHQIDHILRLNTRWVTLFKHYPQLVLYQKGIFLLR